MDQRERTQVHNSVALGGLDLAVCTSTCTCTVLPVVPQAMGLKKFGDERVTQWGGR